MSSLYVLNSTVIDGMYTILLFSKPPCAAPLPATVVPCTPKYLGLISHNFSLPSAPS
ncbi:hypothetical protein BJV78DRAFT_1202207 [Lactifluus subvellereus]|nr:hypothetical protein BJV78DRAFT_1202207 [Lactifluus subvellereus]